MLTARRPIRITPTPIPLRKRQDIFHAPSPPVPSLEWLDSATWFSSVSSDDRFFVAVAAFTVEACEGLHRGSPPERSTQRAKEI